MFLPILSRREHCKTAIQKNRMREHNLVAGTAEHNRTENDSIGRSASTNMAFHNKKSPGFLRGFFLSLCVNTWHTVQAFKDYQLLVVGGGAV
jgi:hypothetical protein